MGDGLDPGWIKASLKYLVSRSYRVEIAHRKTKLDVDVTIRSHEGFDHFFTTLPLHPTNTDILGAAEVLNRRIEETIGRH